MRFPEFDKLMDALVNTQLRDELMKSPPHSRPKAGTKVPEVDTDDLKKMFDHASRLKPGTATAWATGEAICTNGSDVFAVGHRLSMLQLYIYVLGANNRFPDWVKYDKPIDAAFDAIARIPMEYQEVGVVLQGLPFDEDEFLRLIGKAA